MDYSILIVDDEGDIRKLMSLFLEMNKKHTFTIYSAENGKKGINIYSKLTNSGRKPDIVLMDLRMPVMDGVEATRRIIENYPDANVYIFTAYTRTEVEQDALIAGARGTLSKDTDWNRTVASVVNILESS